MAITAAALVRLGTRRRRRRSLPANVPLTKRRRRQRRPCPSRDLYVTGEGGVITWSLNWVTGLAITALGAEQDGLCGGGGDAGIACGRSFRVVLPAAYREPTTEACGRAMMTSETLQATRCKRLFRHVTWYAHSKEAWLLDFAGANYSSQSAARRKHCLPPPFLSKVLGTTPDSGSSEHSMASFLATTNGCHLPSEPAWFLLGGVVLEESRSSYHVAGLALRPALCAGKLQRPAAERRHPERPPPEGLKTSV